MAKTVQKKRLGRGLAALIGDGLGEDAILAAPNALRQVAVDRLKANPKNPRKDFAAGELAELAASIRKNGLLQPILVRPGASAEEFEIVAGERRWRAAQEAGLHDVPVIVRSFSDSEALEVALVENVQRSELNPLEEAEGYEHLIEGYGYTQQQLSDTIGKSRSHIANMLRLRNLPGNVQVMLRDGRLSMGHGRALLASDNPEGHARKVLAQGLSVRATEALTAKSADKARIGAAPRGRKATRIKDADTRALERNLSDAIGFEVEITHNSATGGTVSVHYKSLEQLDDICQRLSQKPS